MDVVEEDSPSYSDMQANIVVMIQQGIEKFFKEKWVISEGSSSYMNMAHLKDFEAIPPDLPAASSDTSSLPVVRRKSSRVTRPPGWLQDFVTTTNPSANVLDVQDPVTGFPPTYPFVVSTDINGHYLAFLATISGVKEPSTFAQAQQDPQWVEPMHKELQALESNGTWEITDLPKGKRAFGSKWVYKVKLHPYGSLDRCKARLLAKGYNQIEGVDFTESFSPVATIVTVRLLLALAAAREWNLHQLDVNNAFLHGYLSKDVYMKPPKGYNKASPTQVCKLKRSIYVLKQASRQWNIEFTSQLQFYGFIQSPHDPCLFLYIKGSVFLALLVYVDDVLLTGSSLDEIQLVKAFLDHHFSIKDIGQARYFLRLELARSSSELYVNQRKYVLDLLHEAGFTECKSVATPLPHDCRLDDSDSPLLSDPDKFRRLVGRLLYLGFT
ncbi:hypothetical protein Sjap_006606 [Stephania japonica]|uniref:Reverse transcriptase Ty1/copia-type domain-containing protein n=1 Tax=Stephania japonica TaxID=461633 RepID=A0AAP0K7U5_9MAGN